MADAPEHPDCDIKQQVISVPRLKEVDFDAESKKTEQRFGVQLSKVSEDGNEVFSVVISGPPKSIERAELESVFGSHEFLDKLETQFGCVVIKLANRTVLKLCGNELDVTLAISELENIAQAFYAEQEARRQPTLRSDMRTSQNLASNDVAERQRTTRIDNQVLSVADNTPARSSTPVKTDTGLDFDSRAAGDQLKARPFGDTETRRENYTGGEDMLQATSPDQFGDVVLDESAENEIENEELKRLRALATVDFDEALRQLSELKGENFSEYAYCADETKQVVFEWLLNRSESVDQWSRTIKNERLLADLQEPAARSPVDDDEAASDDADSNSASDTDAEESAGTSSPADSDKADNAAIGTEQNQLGAAGASKPCPEASDQPTFDASKKKAKSKSKNKKSKKKNDFSKRTQAQRKKRDRKQEVGKSCGIVFAGVVDASQKASNANPNANHSASLNPFVNNLRHPNADSDHLRPIIIDGNNVAREHGRVGKVYSSRGICIAVNYFRQRGHRDIVVYVPQWRPFGDRVAPPTTDGHLLIELHDKGLLEYTPSRKNPITGRLEASYDDWYIVNAAFLKDGVIVSNDQFRDVISAHPHFATTVVERTLPFNFLGDTFILPPDPRGRFAPSLEDMLRKTAFGPTQNYTQPTPYQLPSTNGFGAPPYSSTNTITYGNSQPGPDTLWNGYRATAYASSGAPSGPSVQQYPSTSDDSGWTVPPTIFQPPSHPQAIRRDLAFNPAFGFGSPPRGFGPGLPPGISKQPRAVTNEETGRCSSATMSASTKPKSIIARQAQSVVRKNDFAADSDEESKLIEQAIQRSRGGVSSPHQIEQATIPSSGFGSGNALSSSEEEEYLDVRTQQPAPLPLADRSKNLLPR